jgi:hypothetical protein
MVADVGDRAETAFVEKDRDTVALELDGEGNAGEQVLARAERVPGLHEVSPGDGMAGPVS